PTQPAAEHREDLKENKNRPSAYEPAAGDDGVAPGPFFLHLEVVGAVAHEGVELLEGAGIEEQVDALARGQLAAGVLLLDGFLGGRVDRRLAQFAQVGD